VRVARYYHTARTAHLERLKEFTPSDFFYTDTRADFDTSVLDAGTPVHRVNIAGLLVSLWRRDYRFLEIPEPMAVRNWPQLLAVIALLKTKALLRRPKTQLVTYCIENFPIDEKLHLFTKIPKSVARPLAKWSTSIILRSMDRIAYGTAGSEINYQEQTFRWARRNSQSRLIEALPRAREEMATQRRHTFVFLGTFEERKGFDILLRTWPTVSQQLPNANLVLLGKGHLTKDARVLAERDEVTLHEDPARQLIWDELASSQTLVLPSQPAPGFREQVGLPLVEGLSSGCRIVTSDETGIASWLEINGHMVLPSLASDLAWADAMVQSAHFGPDPVAVLATLPTEDGRVAADNFLTGAGDCE